MSIDLSGKIALVTGAASGIGEAVARTLAAAGASVVLSDLATQSDKAAAVVDDIVAAGAVAEFQALDISEEQQWIAVIKHVQARYGALDVLVNNAGFGTSGEFWTAPQELLQRQLDVNVTAVMELTRAALPDMIARGAGRIVNVASVAGLISGRGSTYSASKAWVVSFTEGLDGGLAGTGVRMMALCPGFVRTEFHSRAGIEMSTVPSFMWLSVDKLVGAALTDLGNGKVISVPGVQYKALVAASRLIPRGIARRVAGRVVRARGRT